MQPLRVLAVEVCQHVDAAMRFQFVAEFLLES